MNITRANEAGTCQVTGVNMCFHPTYASFSLSLSRKPLVIVGKPLISERPHMNSRSHMHRNLSILCQNDDAADRYPAQNLEPEGSLIFLLQQSVESETLGWMTGVGEKQGVPVRRTRYTRT